jgi:archaellum biogenesis protein FlaJ (TadC family)
MAPFPHAHRLPIRFLAKLIIRLSAFILSGEEAVGELMAKAA